MSSGSASPQLGIRTLPGTRTSCALLTVLTILLAWPNPPVALAVLVRPSYFALLSWFFWRTARASPELQGQPMNLVRGGFLILCIGFTSSAIVHFAGVENDHPAFAYLRQVCERGALFLLGTTLTAYGLMLWIPQVIASHQLLEQHAARQRGELQDAASARSLLEQRLVDADRRGMLGELAASIAHDLRNPLTIVKGTAESLCRRPRTTHEIAEHTAVIQRNVAKADRIIESLIGLARPRAEAPELLAPHDILSDVADLLQVEARRQRVPLVVARGAAGCPPLRTDRTLISQALLNLVLNAVQATSSGGTVRLNARCLTRAGHRALAFTVEDRGCGLPVAVRSRLFTPFFTTKPNGTGLGLSSCRRIATELQGHLRLYPRSRGGTRSLLVLPLTPTSNPTPPTGIPEKTACATTSC